MDRPSARRIKQVDRATQAERTKRPSGQRDKRTKRRTFCATDRTSGQSHSRRADKETDLLHDDLHGQRDRPSAGLVCEGGRVRGCEGGGPVTGVRHARVRTGGEEMPAFVALMRMVAPWLRSGTGFVTPLFILLPARQISCSLVALGNELRELAFRDHNPRQPRPPRPVSNGVLQSTPSVPDNHPVRGQFQLSPRVSFNCLGAPATIGNQRLCWQSSCASIRRICRRRTCRQVGIWQGCRERRDEPEATAP